MEKHLLYAFTQNNLGDDLFIKMLWIDILIMIFILV